MNYRVPSHIHHRAVHDEVVILDARSDAYLGLNGSAAIVWTSIAECGSVESALQTLLARFEVSEVEARRDIDVLVSQLEARSLIERAM